jgi:hypothetical protein
MRERRTSACQRAAEAIAYLRAFSGDGLVTQRGLFHVFLVYRHLEYNQLTGTIPDSLGSLSRLQQLCAPLRVRLVHARASAGLMPSARRCLPAPELLLCSALGG